MITLYGFGPFFGLPDASPFVLKAMFLLKLAGLAYREDHKGYGKAPKGKLPYIDDDGTIIADSTFIRFHIEKKYGIDFDAGLDAERRAVAWSVEKMLEDHLYWAFIETRWMNDANFAAGPGRFFDAVPLPVRGVVKTMVRRKIGKGLKAHGLGRHAPAEITALATRDIDAMGTILGEKPYLMGPESCGADATVAAFLTQGLVPLPDSPLREVLAARPNLVAYRDRMMGTYFPAVKLR